MKFSGQVHVSAVWSHGNDAAPAVRTSTCQLSVCPTAQGTTGNTVRFRNVVGSPGGVAFTTYENSSGFSITVTTADKYTFTLGVTPSITEESGGATVSAGPVTLSA